MVSSCQRVKRLYPCVFDHQDCGFMGGKAGFKDCAKLKEDALRHLRAYQCTKCGKCFGKKYALLRHVNKSKYPCTKRSLNLGSHELAKGLLQDLEGAKGYTEIQAVANQCAPYRNRDVERTRKRQQQARRTCRSDDNQLQEQTIVDPTLLNINDDAVSSSQIDSGPLAAIPGNGNSGVGLLMVSDNPHASHSGPVHPNTTTPLGYRLLGEVNNEHDSSYWDVSSISNILGVGAQENIVPVSGLLASGTTQAHYNAPILPWNNNIRPGIIIPLENVNTGITFPPPTTSSIPDITPSTITTAAYPQPENYTVQHNSEGAMIDLFAQPFIFVGWYLPVECELFLSTKVPIVEEDLGDLPMVGS
ncbi:hypothetical protein L211DRAFT_869638 [Terfezia boudieri ATCC MYA-4762]|uniref:C2H2-type domain-containing protein n=1 Tax=Terfezia boudieri ATCC MYA-4762 TaxID=1051890 RepID=A0A3N4LGQ8_9PEZI|nr:hypothetical protein L211DRAFT_869638 [Terfezia boudieri ATCC MYA-4762]